MITLQGIVLKRCYFVHNKLRSTRKKRPHLDANLCRGLVPVQLPDEKGPREEQPRPFWSFSKVGQGFAMVGLFPFFTGWFETITFYGKEKSSTVPPSKTFFFLYVWCLFFNFRGWHLANFVGCYWNQPIGLEFMDFLGEYLYVLPGDSSQFVRSGIIWKHILYSCCFPSLFQANGEIGYMEGRCFFPFSFSSDGCFWLSNQLLNLAGYQ